MQICVPCRFEPSAWSDNESVLAFRISSCFYCCFSCYRYVRNENCSFKSMGFWLLFVISDVFCLFCFVFVKFYPVA